MKNKHSLCAAFIAVFALSQSLAQDTISLQLWRSGAAELAVTDVAGFVPVDNWNNVRVAGTASLNGLTDSDGTVTGINFAYAASGGVSQISSSATDRNLFMLLNGHTVNSANTLTYTFTNLAPVFTAGYDVYVYLADNDTSGGTHSLDVNSSGSPLSFQTPGDDAAFYTTNGFSLATASTAGNYAVLSGLSGDLVLTFTGDSSSVRGGITGIQLVAVPEPSTFALLSGFVALGAILIRRRCL